MTNSKKRFRNDEEKPKSAQTSPIMWTHVWFGYLCMLPTEVNKTKALPKNSANTKGRKIK